MSLHRGGAAEGVAVRIVVDSLGDDVDEVDLVSFPAKVRQRPVDHVLALRGAVDGDEHVPAGNGRVRLRLLIGALLIAGVGGGEVDLWGRM